MADGALPPLRVGKTWLRLPLRPASATALAEAWLLIDPSAQSQRLLAAIEADPLLAVWSMLSFAPTQRRALATDDSRLDTLPKPLAQPWKAAPAGDAPLPVADGDPCTFAARRALRQACLARYLAAEPLQHAAYRWALLSCAWDELRARGVLPANQRLPKPPCDVAATIEQARQAELDDALPEAVANQAEAIWSRWRSPAGLSGAALDALAQRLTRLDDLQARFAETLEAEKLESLAEWAAGAGHEINNPLAVISGRAQLWLRDETDPQRRHELAVLHTQALRVHEMIADMMLFARPPAMQPDAVVLADLLQTVVDELAERAARAEARLLVALPAAELAVWADAEHLAVALRAVCDNALEAVGAGGVVRVSVDAQPTAATPHVALVVADDGPGIAPEVRRHLFDPYFSGRAAGRGLGMGLAKCWRIITLHGGWIEVDSGVGRGAQFRLCLPQVDIGEGD